MPTRPAPAATEPTLLPEAHDHAKDHSPTGICSADGPPAELRGRRIPRDWFYEIASLDHDRAPSDIPINRWRQFLNDCYKFVGSSENWAERAEKLGWDALALFGCRRNRALEHFGSAGLVWAINGGKLVEVHRDWAVIERAEGRSRHIHHRRSSHAVNTVLPWSGANDVQSYED